MFLFSTKGFILPTHDPPHLRHPSNRYISCILCNVCVTNCHYWFILLFFSTMNIILTHPNNRAGFLALLSTSFGLAFVSTDNGYPGQFISHFGSSLKEKFPLFTLKIETIANKCKRIMSVYTTQFGVKHDVAYTITVTGPSLLHLLT